MKIQRRKMDEGCQDCEEEVSTHLNLLDLPEDVLLHILRFVPYDTLRNVIPVVSKEFRRLSQSKILWLKADVTYCMHDNSKELVRDLAFIPYLRSVKLHSNEPLPPDVASTLATSRCQIQRLTLDVEDYTPEMVAMLQSHPEVEQLSLSALNQMDMDNECTKQIATAVGCMPRLASLDISGAKIVEMRLAGQFLSTPSQGDANGNTEQAGDGAREVPKRAPRRVLRRLTFKPSRYTVFQTGLAIAAKNLAALIRANRKTLRKVKIDGCNKNLDLFLALGECTRLKDLTLWCDRTGAHVRAMLEKGMSQPGPQPGPQPGGASGPGLHTLRKLCLKIPFDVDEENLREVLRTLGRLESRIETLELRAVQDDDEFLEDDPIVDLGNDEDDDGDVDDAGHPPAQFPGFSAFSGLFVDSLLRTTLPCLQELRLVHMQYVGKAQLLELAQLAATANSRVRPGARSAGTGMPLKRLKVLGDCSASGAFAECQNRAVDELRRALPGVEYSGFCSCDDEDESMNDSPESPNEAESSSDESADEFGD